MTTGDRSLLLAQPIIDRLSRPEVDAIVAHELAHLHLKHRSKAILLLLAAAFLVFTIESQIPREQGLAVLLVLMAGLLAAVVLVNAFRRQADYVGGIV
jgi:Zn-dependent protease with chaperone function